MYEPDPITNDLQLQILTGSGPEPEFDRVMQSFLEENLADIRRLAERGGLLKATSLGQRTPWLYCLEFGTKALARSNPDAEVVEVDHSVVAIRFLPDYLRRADKFQMLRLLEPRNPPPWHPNISVDGAICISIHPGQLLSDIAHALHDLFRWRLRQLREEDALNAFACSWGREHVQAPIDDRPLFGRKLDIQLETLGGR